MSISDAFKKGREKNEEHITSPLPGHALTEILRDENKFHLFGKILENGGHHDLAQRLIEKKLEASDIDLLEKQRKVFSEKMSSVEKVANLLSKGGVVELARNNPDFEKVVNLLTPEKAIKVIRSQLLEISITDESRFEYIGQSIEARESYKNGEYKEINDGVEKMLKEKGISSKEYLAALAIEDPEEKMEALDQLSMKTYGGFKKTINFILGDRFSRGTLVQLHESGMSLEDSLTELNTHQNAVASALSSSMRGNVEMRNALNRELLSEKAETEKKAGFSDMKKEVFNEKEVDGSWEDYKTHAGYDGENDFDKDIIKDMFVDEQKKKYKEKNAKNTGFWASIFAAMFEHNMDDKKSTLI